MSLTSLVRTTVARLLLCAALPTVAAHAQPSRFGVTVAPDVHRGPLT